MSKHTPGPWIVDDQSEQDIRRYILASAWPANGAHIVASIRVTTTDGPSLKQAEANACLIAAAPELLEALQDLVANLQRNRDGNYLLINDGTGINRYAAAIAKAIGGAE